MGDSGQQLGLKQHRPTKRDSESGDEVLHLRYGSAAFLEAGCGLAQNIESISCLILYAGGRDHKLPSRYY